MDSGKPQRLEFQDGGNPEPSQRYSAGRVRRRARTMLLGIVRDAERTRMDARAGAQLQGWLLRAHVNEAASDAEVMDQHLIHLQQYAFSSGPIAQRLVQKTHNLLVPGSNPGGPTKHGFQGIPTEPGTGCKALYKRV